ncbi:transmembrane protein, putative, partial [Bodo saltans]
RDWTCRGDMHAAKIIFFFVTGGYRDSTWFWECVSLARKLLLVLAVTVPEADETRALLATWVLIASVMLNIVAKPWAERWLSIAEATSLATVAATFGLNALLLLVPTLSSTASHDYSVATTAIFGAVAAVNLIAAGVFLYAISWSARHSLESNVASVANKNGFHHRNNITTDGDALGNAVRIFSEWFRDEIAAGDARNRDIEDEAASKQLELRHVHQRSFATMRLEHHASRTICEAEKIIADLIERAKTNAGKYAIERPFAMTSSSPTGVSSPRLGQSSSVSAFQKHQSDRNFSRGNFGYGSLLVQRAPKKKNQFEHVLYGGRRRCANRRKWRVDQQPAAVPCGHRCHPSSAEPSSSTTTTTTTKYERSRQRREDVDDDDMIADASSDSALSPLAVSSSSVRRGLSQPLSEATTPAAASQQPPHVAPAIRRRGSFVIRPQPSLAEVTVEGASEYFTLHITNGAAVASQIQHQRSAHVGDAGSPFMPATAAVLTTAAMIGRRTGFTDTMHVRGNRSEADCEGERNGDRQHHTTSHREESTEEGTVEPSPHNGRHQPVGPHLSHSSSHSNSLSAAIKSPSAQREDHHRLSLLELDDDRAPPETDTPRAAPQQLPQQALHLSSSTLSPRYYTKPGLVSPANSLAAAAAAATTASHRTTGPNGALDFCVDIRTSNGGSQGRISPAEEKDGTNNGSDQPPLMIPNVYNPLLSLSARDALALSSSSSRGNSGGKPSSPPEQQKNSTVPFSCGLPPSSQSGRQQSASARIGASQVSFGWSRDESQLQQQGQPSSNAPRITAIVAAAQGGGGDRRSLGGTIATVAAHKRLLSRDVLDALRGEAEEDAPKNDDDENSAHPTTDGERRIVETAVASLRRALLRYHVTYGYCCLMQQPSAAKSDEIGATTARQLIEDLLSCEEQLADEVLKLQRRLEDVRSWI